MTEERLWQQLRDILKEVRPQAPHSLLGLDDDIVERLGLDSLDMANFAVEIQYGFALTVESAQVAELLTLRTLGAFILQQMSLSAPAES